MFVERNNGFGDFGFSLSSILNPLSALKSGPGGFFKSMMAPAVSAVKTVASTVKPLVKAATVGPVIAALNPVKAVQTTAQQIGRTIGIKNVQSKIQAPALLQKIAAAPAIPLTMIEGKSGLIQKVTGGTLTSEVGKAMSGNNLIAKSSPATNQIQYQDENGNPITKEQYDAIMAQYQAQQASGQNIVYQDENGNVISKDEYDRRMQAYAQAQAQQAQAPSISPTIASPNQPSWNFFRAAPAQVQQTAQMPDGGGGTDTGQSSGIDMTAAMALDPNSQKAQEILNRLRAKVISGQSLTGPENEFIAFMVDAVQSSDSLSGFGELPVWNGSVTPEHTLQDSESLFYEDLPDEVIRKIEEDKIRPVSDTAMPSFNALPPGISNNVGFYGIDDWRRI